MVAIEHQLTVIEDDVFGFLAPDVKPLSSLLPEDQFLYITSTSKSIAPGIRIGYLLAPASMIERVSVSVLRTMVNAPPAMAELATSLITEGVAGRIVEWKRKEIAARQDIAVRVLAGLVVQTHPNSPHVWVRLPEPWRTDAFVARARHRGILLNSAESFAVGHETDVQAVQNYARPAGHALGARGWTHRDRPHGEPRSRGLRARRLNYHSFRVPGFHVPSSDNGTRNQEPGTHVYPPRLDDRARRIALPPSADRAAVSRADRSSSAPRSRTPFSAARC